MSENINGVNPHTKQVLESWHYLEINRGNQHVSIDPNAIDTIAQLHYQDILEIPSWRFNGVHSEDNSAFASSVLTHNTINAAYNFPDGSKYSVPYDGNKLLTGAYGMVRCFYRVFGEHQITTDYLDANFPTIEATRLFFQGVSDIPYPDLRFIQLRDFIDGLRKRHENPLDILIPTKSFNPESHLVGLRAFDTRTKTGLVDILIRRFPVAYGADKQYIDQLIFPFYKRAQLAALVLHGRATNSDQNPTANRFKMTDIDLIGPIADYEVPRTLRALGIISVTNVLADKIQSRNEIAKDSQEEIELRAATVVGCVQLLDKINVLRQQENLPRYNISHLDYWLWSQAKNVAKDIPPHLTKTMSY